MTDVKRIKPRKEVIAMILKNHGHKSGDGLSLTKMSGNGKHSKVQVQNPIFVQYKHPRGTTIIARNQAGNIHQIVHHTG